MDGDDTLEAALAVDASASDACAANAPAGGDVVAVEPSFGSSEGGTEIVVVLGSVTARPADECAGNWAACRVGTAWPVLGYLTATGVSCVAPARPGTTEVSAPRMLAGAGRRPLRVPRGGGQPFGGLPGRWRASLRSLRARLRATARGREGPPAVRRRVGARGRGARRARSVARRRACFPRRLRERSRGGARGGARLRRTRRLRDRRPVRDALGARRRRRRRRGALRRRRARRRRGRGVLRGARRGFGVRVPPGGGARARVPSRRRRRDDHVGVPRAVGDVGRAARVSLRVDRARHRRHGVRGETFRAACVAPRAPGVAPVALVPDWRDAAFVPSAAFAYVDDRGDGEGGSGSGNELATRAPRVRWASRAGAVRARRRSLGDVGRRRGARLREGLPRGRGARRARSAAPSRPTTSPPRSFCATLSPRSAGWRSASAGAPRRFPFASSRGRRRRRRQRGGERADAKTRTRAGLFVVRRAAVIGVDFGSGWAAGGGHVDVELAAWAPTGMLDCHFGAVHVRGRGSAARRGRPRGGARAVGGRRGRGDERGVRRARVEGRARAPRRLARALQRGVLREDVEYQYF